MQILFFGSIREKLGQAEAEIGHGGQSLIQLKIELEQQYEILKEQPYRFAVNETVLLDMNYKVAQEDIIALLPPFSGG